MQARDLRVVMKNQFVLEYLVNYCLLVPSGKEVGRATGATNEQCPLAVQMQFWHNLRFSKVDYPKLAGPGFQKKSQIFRRMSNSFFERKFVSLFQGPKLRGNVAKYHSKPSSLSYKHYPAFLKCGIAQPSYLRAVTFLDFAWLSNHLGKGATTPCRESELVLS